MDTRSRSRRALNRNGVVDEAADMSESDGRVQLFGEYLQDEGIIDARQLREAVELVFYVNRNVGEIGLQLGYLRKDDVDRICRAQATSDGLFGEIATELGLLTQDQVFEILAQQKRRETRLGEALVELGHLEADECKRLLETYEAEQRRWLPEARSLPPGLHAVGLARLVLEQIPKQLLRTSLIPMRIGAWRPCPAFDARERFAGLEIRAGGTDLAVGLAVPPGLDAALDPPGLDVFLVQVAAGLLSRLSSKRATEGFESSAIHHMPDGWAFEYTSTQGRGELFLSG